MMDSSKPPFTAKVEEYLTTSLELYSNFSADSRDASTIPSLSSREDDLFSQISLHRSASNISLRPIFSPKKPNFTGILRNSFPPPLDLDTYHTFLESVYCDELLDFWNDVAQYRSMSLFYWNTNRSELDQGLKEINLSPQQEISSDFTTKDQGVIGFSIFKKIEIVEESPKLQLQLQPQPPSSHHSQISNFQASTASFSFVANPSPSNMNKIAEKFSIRLASVEDSLKTMDQIGIRSLPPVEIAPWEYVTAAAPAYLPSLSSNPQYLKLSDSPPTSLSPSFTTKSGPAYPKSRLWSTIRVHSDSTKLSMSLKESEGQIHSSPMKGSLSFIKDRHLTEINSPSDINPPPIVVTTELLQSKVEHIWFTYLVSGSRKEVNLPQSTTKKIHRYILVFYFPLFCLIQFQWKPELY